MATATTGKASAVAIQNFFLTARSSESSSVRRGVSGSSAMPQIGQDPGPV